MNTPTITTGKYKVYTGIGALESAIVEAGVSHGKLWACYIYVKDGHDQDWKEQAIGYLVGQRRPKGHQLMINELNIIVGDEL